MSIAVLSPSPIIVPMPVDALLHRADLSRTQLAAAVTAAEEFNSGFAAAARRATAATGLSGLTAGKAEQKFIRQSGGVPEAVLAKLSANSIAKRRPEDAAPFLAHLRARHAAQAPLELRLGAGPVKNVQHYGANQTPDLAEYLMLTQLARVAKSVATLYPHGVKVHMVPDDKRGGDANQWPAEYGQRYIAGMQQLVRNLGYDGWLKVEDGQQRLYEHYRVASFRAAAEEQLRDWQRSDPAAYAAKLERAAAKAGENMVSATGAPPTAADAQASALRYLIALKAEEMSGIFAPRDAFPLRYANHPGSFQLYTMGQGQTKLPWQIALPPTLLQTEPVAALAPHRPPHTLPIRQVPLGAAVAAG